MEYMLLGSAHSLVCYIENSYITLKLDCLIWVSNVIDTTGVCRIYRHL
jgi:hypothetical protein